MLITSHSNLKFSQDYLYQNLSQAPLSPLLQPFYSTLTYVNTKQNFFVNNLTADCSATTQFLLYKGFQKICIREKLLREVKDAGLM